MIFIVVREGKPVGVIKIDDKGATIAFEDDGQVLKVVRAEGSLLPAFVRLS
jgi:hypothetical protein